MDRRQGTPTTIPETGLSFTEEFPRLTIHVDVETETDARAVAVACARKEGRNRARRDSDTKDNSPPVGIVRGQEHIMRKAIYDAEKLADMGYGNLGQSEVALTDAEVANLARCVGGAVSDIELCWLRDVGGHSPATWTVSELTGIISEGGESFGILNGGTIINDWTEEQAARARLIAAAPELLSALRSAKQILETAKNYFPKSIHHADKFSLLNIIANAVDPAIAKAEGRTP